MRISLWCQRLITDEDGVSTVEYALLLSAIVLGLTVTWHSLGDGMVKVVGDTNEVLSPTPQALGCAEARAHQ